MACHVAWDWSQAARFDCSEIFTDLDILKIKDIAYEANRPSVNFQSTKVHSVEHSTGKSHHHHHHHPGKQSGGRTLPGKYHPARGLDRHAHTLALRAEHNDAVRKYYAAFPALTSPPAAPPPAAWVRPAPPPPAPQPHAARKPRRARRRPPPAARPPPAVPDRDDLDLPDLPDRWTLEGDDPPRTFAVDDREFAEFRAKFDSGIEALWADTPDEDDYRDLPIDIRDLLSSPSDGAFADPAPDPTLVADAPDAWPGVDALGDRLLPLKLADEAFAPTSGDPFASLLPDALAVRRSLAALGHDRSRSAFVSVPPGSIARLPSALARPVPPARTPLPPDEDPLTSTRTHFRPIRGEAETGSRGAGAGAGGAAEGVWADGATFPVRGSPMAVSWRRSADGGLYAADSPRRYLECGLEGGGRLRFPAVRADVAVQTECQPRTDRKRRHSAALRACCGHPHAPFLQCCPQDRPLTR